MACARAVFARSAQTAEGATKTFRQVGDLGVLCGKNTAQSAQDLLEGMWVRRKLEPCGALTTAFTVPWVQPGLEESC